MAMQIKLFVVVFAEIKLPFQNMMFSIHSETPEKLVFSSNSSGLKRVFEKLCFRDGLVWTVGLTVEIKLRFQMCPV